jgi:hypothetical protein
MDKPEKINARSAKNIQQILGGRFAVWISGLLVRFLRRKIEIQPSRRLSSRCPVCCRDFFSCVCPGVLKGPGIMDCIDVPDGVLLVADERKAKIDGDFRCPGCGEDLDECGCGHWDATFCPRGSLMVAGERRVT